MTVITPCRPAEPHEIPKTAKKLATVAEANGWDVHVTYAKAKRDDDDRVVESVVVRMWREGKLYGAWIGGKFAGGGCLSRRFGAGELQALVQMNRDELASNLLGLKVLEAVIR